MIATTSADLLTGLWYPEHVATRFEGPIEQVGRGGAVVASLEKELQRYFDGELRQFTVPTAITHSPEALAQLPGTELQKAVWWQVAQVGFGELTTYGQIAREIGRPGASRPVGQAVGRNPISIVVGCHRVVGAGGKITGYAGGLERKRKLLHIEGHSGY